MNNKGKDVIAAPPGYEKINFLGKGSAAEVWAVRREIDDKRLALKISKAKDPARRLEREFAILERLDVYGVVKAIEFGEHEDSHFFVMELVEGLPFTEFMSLRRANPDFVDIFYTVFQRVALVLSKLHRQGIVHIDLKPANLLIKNNGEPVLLDFGFAEDYLLSPTSEPSGTTLDYAAPELFTGGYVTPAADIYSLGTMGYETLKGCKLWAEKSARELIRAKLKTPPGLGRLDFDLPAGLEAMILRMLSPEPSLRPSAEEIVLEINSLFKSIVPSSADLAIPLPRLVFGGRDEEISKIERLLLEENRVLILSGESGMGKTRLLRELKFRALVNDQNVLLLEGRGAHLSLADHILATLGIEHEENQDKWRRFERIYRGISDYGFKAFLLDAPLDLTTDEKQLLGYLARGFDMKTGMLLAQTPREVYPDALELTLKALDEAKVSGLIRRTFEGFKHYEKLSKILASTGAGNPRRMNELLDILHDEGWLTWRRGWLYEPGKGEEELSARLETWLGETLSRLDDEAILVLNLLSAVDSGLSADVLTKIMGDFATLELKELMTKGLVRSFLYLGIPHYEFGNDVIKPYILAHLGKEEKATLAAIMAEALEEYSVALWGGDCDSWDINYLAHAGMLFLRSGITNKAAFYLVAAGKRLVNLGDSERSKKLLHDALALEPENSIKKTALLELGGIAHYEHDAKMVENYYSQAQALMKNEPREQAVAYIRTGLAYQRIQDFERAAFFFEKGEDILPDASGELKALLLYAKGWNATLVGKVDEGVGFLQESLSSSSASYGKSRALSAISSALLRKGKAREAFEYATRAFESAEDSALKATTTVYVVDTLFSTGDFSEISRYIENALSLTKGASFPALSVELMSLKTRFLYYTGRYREACGVIREAIEISEKINDQYRIDSLRWAEAYCLVALGDMVNAQKNFIALWRKYHRSSRNLKNLTLMEWALLYSARGNFPAATRMLEKAALLFESQGDAREFLKTRIRLCRTVFESGDLQKAETLIKQARETLVCQEEFFAAVTLDLLEAQIALSAKDIARAAALSSRASANLDRYPLGFENLKGDALLVSAKILAESGKPKEGLEKLSESLRLSLAQETPYSQALVLFEMAVVVLESSGSYSDAEYYLGESRALAERIGAAHILKKIDELQKLERRVKKEEEKKSAEYLDGLNQVSELIKDLRSRHLEQRKSGLDLKYLEGLKKLSELINYRLGEANFMDDLLEIVLELTRAKRGVVFIARAGELHPVSSKLIDEAASHEAQKISETVISELEKGMIPIYTPDASFDERFNRSQSILLHDIRSLLCIPLKTRISLVGTIYVDSPEPGLFDQDNTLYFEAVGNILAATIERSMEFKRLAEDLSLLRARQDFRKSGTVIGSSTAALKLYDKIERISQSNANILLEGETGTGKGVFARLIHSLSARKEREFCSINCGVLPEAIMESELFGTKKGAYTGASQDRAGLLEAADHSTVFFDEITNTTPLMQAKLLEVIEERVIRRVGDSKVRKVDLRFVFATNRDLENEVRAGRFREDLFFRISTMTIRIPPLRERKEDLSEYVEFFIKKFSTEFNKEIRAIDDAAQELLADYSWPGNIRELRNVIERSVLLAETEHISEDALKQNFPPIAKGSQQTPEAAYEEIEAGKLPLLEDATRMLEKRLIDQALARYKTAEKAAAALGISARSLWRKKKESDK